jgi:predicted cation transporter
VAIGLGLILIAVLLGPIFIKPIERNLELFFLVLGVLAAVAGGQFGWPLLRDALTQPIGLTAAVLVFGVLARLLRPAFDASVQKLRAILPARWIYFFLIISLGLVSSLITAVVAALLLVEAIAMLKLDRPSETAAVVLACFAIGLGSGLMPTGGPLASIAIAALDADFGYLLRLLWPLVLAGIVIVGMLSLFIPPIPAATLYAARPEEGWKEIIVRAVRIYAFVAGLVGLSWGARPVVGAYVSHVPQGSSITPR